MNSKPPQAHPQRRHYSRIPFDARADLLLAHGRTVPVRLIDLSLKGALVTRPADPALAQGEAARLVVHLGEGAQFEMEVEVAHLHARSVGLACQRIELDALTELKRLVALNLADEQLLYRELAELSVPDGV